ncbi:hypothetical protein ACIRPH_26975 [Nocardiopsis sp. NPDC101807]|uniref:hypothetical protein n=1 Tax=Nocardiopsis sp. NPDC101807 TaxID=3364339 RepID=UPI0037F5737A
MGRTGHDDDNEAEEDAGKKKRIELSVSQVAGAGAATLAAATAASYLNVYGTVVGAAVMATLSTLVSPLLQHWFSRSGEQARQLAGKAVGHAEAGPVAPGAPVAPFPEEISESGLLREVSEAGPPDGAPRDFDATRTMAMPSLGAVDDRTAALGGPGDPANRAGVPDGTALLPAVDTGAPVPGASGDREGGGFLPRLGRRSVVIPAAAVFALVMLVILVFELFTGRSLTAWTQGGEEATSPTLFGGSSSGAPAQEDDPGAGETTEDEPWTTDQEPGTGTPGTTPEPDAPATGEPEDGTGGGGTGGDGGTGGTTEPTDPPVEEEEPQDPGTQQPDPGTGDGGGQGGGTPAPAPVPAPPAN